MFPEQIPGENDQADMQGTSMADLPGTDDGTKDEVDVDAEELEEAQLDAAEKREQEGGYQ
ncbi:hypothetical protein ACGGKE_18370 (plasmid) [Sphingobium naphthae]|uniref:hypothetical protein n=1 Tax=Sphingobium naphthae TaxID=1886786 RepID=UPI0037490B25